MTTTTAFEDTLKDPMLLAWRRIVDPLVEMLFDSGVTVQEITRLIRERSIHAATRVILKECGRVSNSRIAIMTGLPRSEVSRVLKAKDNSRTARPGNHPARRVLAAWYESPTFLGANGKPATLPIFGKHRSFEQLVQFNGGGIPVRAMLDQLLQIDAIEILRDQRVKARSRIPVLTGLSGTAIANLGDRIAELIETLKVNLRKPMDPLFERTAVMGRVDLDLLPLIREEIALRAAKFIDSTNAIFNRSRSKSARIAGRPSQACRIGLTLYYFENEPPGGDITHRRAKLRRKNLKRTVRR
jgi:hypothetical protein